MATSRHFTVLKRAEKRRRRIRDLISRKNRRGGEKRRAPNWRNYALAVLVLLALALAGTLALRWSRFGAEARANTAYGAHIACACHYIAGRPLADCRKDLEPGMRLIMLSANEHAHSVTARLFPLASDTATWRAGPGCVLGSWK